MKNLIPFSYEDTEIRAVEIDGEPWLVAKDICDYFGVSNRNRLLQQVDSLDKGGTRLDTPGGNAYRILATDLQAWLEQLPDA